MWNLSGLGIEPMSPALASRFFTMSQRSPFRSWYYVNWHCYSLNCHPFTQTMIHSAMHFSPICMHPRILESGDIFLWVYRVLTILFKFRMVWLEHLSGQIGDFNINCVKIKILVCWQISFEGLWAQFSNFIPCSVLIICWFQNWLCLSILSHLLP